MAANFPNNPNTNDTFTSNGVTFKWDGSAWKQPASPGVKGLKGDQGEKGEKGVTRRSKGKGTWIEITEWLSSGTSEEEEEESRQKGRRRSRRKSRNNFVYGEVVLEPFFEFVSRSSELCTPTKETKKYYDLGSGSGKSVFIAALTGKFSFAGGCEILKCLHGVATTVVEDYKQIIEPMMKRSNSNRKMKTELRVDLNDIFSPECVRMWSQCEYVFCNCLTWEDEQMESLARAAEHLKEGSIFVTVLLPLPSDKFEVIAEEECLFSWGGKAPLVVHKKRRQLEGENDLLASLGKMNNLA